MHDMQATRRMQAVSSRAGPEPGSVGRVTIKRASGIIFLGAMLPAQCSPSVCRSSINVYWHANQQTYDTIR